jgi:two-component system sensor histidine kinase TctE
MRSRSTFRACAPSSSRPASRSARCAASATCSKNSRKRSSGGAQSPRAPAAHAAAAIAALLGLGAVIAYYPSIEPATEAYDQSLVDIGIALGSHIRAGTWASASSCRRRSSRCCAPTATTRSTTASGAPDGQAIAGDLDLPASPEDGPGLHYYNTTYKDRSVRAVSMPAQCGAATCTVVVAETTVKRTRMAREILLSNVLPER